MKVEKHLVKIFIFYFLKATCKLNVSKQQEKVAKLKTKTVLRSQKALRKKKKEQTTVRWIRWQSEQCLFSIFHLGKCLKWGKYFEKHSFSKIRSQTAHLLNEKNGLMHKRIKQNKVGKEGDPFQKGMISRRILESNLTATHVNADSAFTQFGVLCFLNTRSHIRCAGFGFTLCWRRLCACSTKDPVLFHTLHAETLCSTFRLPSSSHCWLHTCMKHSRWGCFCELNVVRTSTCFHALVHRKCSALRINWSWLLVINMSTHWENGSVNWTVGT